MAYTRSRVFESPQCLVNSDDNGKLFINGEVLRQIKRIDRKLNIITIAGTYRTGKSYLLNRLAGINRGFPLGRTIEAKTKGIWIWCRPHPYHIDQVLLLMDTEGLGDIAKGDRNHDNQIFALAILLSSTLVYNTLGVFQEDDLEKLSFVTEVSKYIKISDKPFLNNDEDLDMYFPMFIVALRDFSLELKIDEREITPDEYLEERCLQLRPERNERDRKYNEPRLCIRKYFKKRSCFTFDRPASRSKLLNLEELSDSDLSEDFVKDSDAFTYFVYTQCSPKRLHNGSYINGRMFATLAECYVEAVRTGKMPCIESALESMAKLENKKLVEQSCRVYIDGMKTLELPTEDELTLFSAHRRWLRIALNHFVENSVYDKDEEYQKEVNRLLLEEYKTFQIADETASMELCNNILKRLNHKVQRKLVDNAYIRSGGLAEYSKDVNEIKDAYSRTTGLGCKKEEALWRFSEEKYNAGKLIQQADRAITEKERQAYSKFKRTRSLRHERQQANIIEAEKKKQEQQAMQYKRDAEIVRWQMEENIKRLETKRQTELKHMQNFYEDIEQKRIGEMDRFKNEMSRKRDEMYRKERQVFKESEILKQKFRTEEKRIKENLKRYQYHLEEIKRENARLKTSLHEQRKRLDWDENEYEERHHVKGATAALQKRLSSLETENRSLKSENREIKDQLEQYTSRNGRSCILQ